MEVCLPEKSKAIGGQFEGILEGFAAVEVCTDASKKDPIGERGTFNGRLSKYDRNNY